MFEPETQKSPPSPKNPKPTLESVILGLLQYAQQIPINSPDTITAPLVNEFSDYDKALTNLFSISLHRLLTLDLSIEVKSPKELEERINGLHFVLFKVVPILNGFNVLELSGLLGGALLESIDKYRSLPAESTQPWLLEAYDETEFCFKYPGLSPKFEEYVNALSSLTENLTQVKPQQASRYTLKRFTDNLDFLLKKTQSKKLPIESLSEELDEQIKLVFKISCYIKDCHNQSEAMILLPKIKALLDELAVKLSANENSTKVQLLGKRFKHLAQQTEQTREQLATATVSEVEAKQSTLLSAESLEAIVQSFFDQDIASVIENEKLNALLKDDNVAQELATRLSKRLTREIESWPNIDKLTLSEASEWLAKCTRSIDQTLNFVNQISENRPGLAAPCSHLIYDLFTQISYYTLVADRYFELLEDINSDTLFCFSVLQQYNQVIECFSPRYHELIVDKIRASIDKTVSFEDRQTNKRQVYSAHYHFVLQKLSFALICVRVHEYSLAHQSCKETQKATLGINASVNKLDINTDLIIVSKYQKLLMKSQAKLEMLIRLIKHYNEKKQLPANQGKHVVVFVNKNDTVQTVKVTEIIDSMVKSIDKVTPDENSPEYEKLSKKYSKESKVYPVRLAMINCVAERFVTDSKIKMMKETRTSAERITRIQEHQKNINALYYFLCTIAKDQVNKFPNADSMHRLFGLVILNIHMQTKEFEKLLLNREVPEGQYAALYKMIRGNYVVIAKQLPEFIEETKQNPEECDIRLKALLEVHIEWTCTFEQFAETTFAQATFNQALNILQYLNDMNALTPQESERYHTLLANCKSYELSDAAELRTFFDFVFNQSRLIHDSLIKLGNDDKALVQRPLNESTQSIADNLRERVKHSKNDFAEMADILLNLNKESGLENTMIILTELKIQFEELQQQYFKHKIGMYGLIAEAMTGITLDIDNCLSSLEKKVELQAKKAENQAKIEEANRLARAKQDIRREQERLRKEARKNASTQRKSVVEISDEASSEAPLEPAKVKPKPKPLERTKQNRLNQTVVQSTPDYTQYQEPKLNKKKRRRQQRAIKEAQEREARITEQKQSQMRQKSAAKQSLNPQGLDFEGQHLPPNPVVIVKTSQLEKLMQEKVEDDKLKTLMMRIDNWTLEESKPQPRSQALPLIKQRVAQLERFFTPVRVKHKLTSLPDEAYQVEGYQIRLDPNHKAVLALFRWHGVRAYLYGGYPRDALLGREPHDADFVVFCSPQKAKEILGARFKDNANHEKQFVFEGADVRCEDETLSLWDFAQGRDITINALLVDENGNIFAPILRSIKDLKRTELHSIGNCSQTYKDDPRRMFRLIRQSHEMERWPSESQEVALLENAHLLTTLPFNQYAMHFSSLFIRGTAWLNVRYLIKLRLLHSLLPPLKVIDYADTDTLSWYESECMKVDLLGPNGAKTYSFNKLIAIFLTPLLVTGFKEGGYSLEEKIERVIFSFNEVFKEQSEADKNLLSALLKSYYLQYLGHQHQLRELRMTPQAPAAYIEPAGMAYTPSFNQSPAQVNRFAPNGDRTKRVAYRK